MNLRHTPVARVAFALLAIAVCLLLMREAARIGFSRLLTRYALVSNSLPAADQALQLTPTDPDAHRARATVLKRLGRTAEAQTSLQFATGLRPHDNRLWLELGDTRDELGDNEGALAAMNEAVRWAPYYAKPRWQRGNLLLRIGHYNEAFSDLRYAASRDKKLQPTLIDLAWGLTGDAQATESLLQISNDNDRLTFARFLAAKGKGVDVDNQVRLLTTPLSDENKQELSRLLMAKRDFSTAYRLWAGVQSVERVVNGGFEQPLLLNGSPLGWVVAHPQTEPKFAIDVSEKVGGEKSLQVTFDGEWDASSPSLSQTVVVRPGQRYRLNFAVKTKDLVTGGPPRIVLTDATNDQILARSDTFPRDTNSWRQMAVEFTAPADALVIRLTRENCTSAPCPIFGLLWLDEFSLEKL